MPSSVIFLRSVLRLMPSISAAFTWLPPARSSTTSMSGRSTALISRACRSLGSAVASAASSSARRRRTASSSGRASPAGCRGCPANAKSSGTSVRPPVSKAALLEDAQELRLERQRHVGDLVQEQRAACGGLELADAPLDRAREGAALVAEELTLEELVRDGRAVERHEGSAARGVLVDGLGDQLIARPGLALAEHRRVGGCDAADHLISLSHDRV